MTEHNPNTEAVEEEMRRLAADPSYNALQETLLHQAHSPEGDSEADGLSDEEAWAAYEQNEVVAAYHQSAGARAANLKGEDQANDNTPASETGEQGYDEDDKELWAYFQRAWKGEDA